MAASYSKSKGRSNTPSTKSFAGIPRFIMEHQDYINLSCHAKALLLEAAKQYRGNNNGDICLSWSLMQKRGVGSKPVVYRAIKELTFANLLIETRSAYKGKGNNRRCALYALTWEAIDECRDKNLEHLATVRPLRKVS